MAQIRLEPLPPQEAIEFFAQKGLKIGFDWRDVYQQEHQSSFTVAKVMQLDLLADIKDSLLAVKEQGIPFAQWAKDLKPTLVRQGWWGKAEMTDPVTGEKKLVQLGSTRRLKVIYDTNLRTAHSEGQWERIQQNKEAFPYLIYDANNSAHPRAEHSAWDNLVLPVDDPFWQEHLPVKEWGCKCRVRALTRGQADRQGLPIGPAPVVPRKAYVNKRTGQVSMVPQGVHPAFHYPPGGRRENLKRLLKQRQDEFKGAMNAVSPAASPRLWPDDQEPVFSTAKGIDRAGLERILGEVPGAQVAVAKVRQFMQAHPIKVLFIKPGEMGGRAKARAIASAVGQFLGGRWQADPLPAFYYRRAARINGFTSDAYEHLVIKAKANERRNDVVPADLAKAVDSAIAANLRGDRNWNLRAALDQLTGGKRSGVTATFMHELGHQVHYWAGAPPRPSGMRELTVYSGVNHKEWHAEHFAAWVFNRAALERWDQNVTQYFDNLAERATRGTNKSR